MDRRTLLKLLPLSLVVACSDNGEAEDTSGGDEDAPGGTVGYEQWDGLDSGTSEPLIVMAGTEEEWTSLWQLAGQAAPEPFDPNIQTAAGIFLGQRRTGGYAVLIDGVSLDGDAIKIDWTERKPGIDEFVTQAFTSPWAILLIDARATNIEAPVPAPMD